MVSSPSVSINGSNGRSFVLAFALARLACTLVLVGLAFALVVRARPCTVVHSTPRTVSLELSILTAQRRQIHRHKLRVSSC